MRTAREVAAEVGVSVSTIGRAMADDPRISAETKARVKRAAERLGYVGNNPARVMRGASSNLIGLMIPDVGNDFYAAIAQTMSDCVDRQGYRLVLALTGDDRDVEARQIRELVGARAAGIILVPTARPRRESRTMLSSVPHVQFLRHVNALGGSRFGIDDEAAIEQATQHLLDLGHRQIAYIGGYAALSTGAARHAGYQSAMRQAGAELSSTLEHLGPPVAGFAAECVDKMLRLKTPPTAIVTGSVHITEGVIAVIEREQIVIPQTLSLIGFGNASWFSWWRGGLTTVAPPVQDLATSCGLWFLNHLSTKGADPIEYSSTIQSSFILRRTTASPRNA